MVQVVDWRIKGGLVEHEAGSDPHEQYLKKTQKASEQEAVSGAVDNKFSTPKTVKAFVKQLGFGGYLNDVSRLQGSLNDMTDSGLYALQSSECLKDLPPSEHYGFNLLVMARASTYIMQLAFPISYPLDVFYIRNMIVGEWQQGFNYFEKHLLTRLYQGDSSETGWRIEPDGYIEMWGI